MSTERVTFRDGYYASKRAQSDGSYTLTVWYPSGNVHLDEYFPDEASAATALFEQSKAHFGLSFGPALA